MSQEMGDSEGDAGVTRERAPEGRARESFGLGLQGPQRHVQVKLHPTAGGNAQRHHTCMRIQGSGGSHGKTVHIVWEDPKVEDG